MYSSVIVTVSVDCAFKEGTVTVTSPSPTVEIPLDVLTAVIRG